MKDRILVFLNNENKSYAQFAEEIGVQPSGISHILSGRNNPSLDFVLKMLHRYPSLSAEWLLFGHGSMYKQVSEPTLFNEEPLNLVSEVISDEPGVPVASGRENGSEAEFGRLEGNKADAVIRETGDKRLVKVLLLYSDRSFTEYFTS